MPFINDRLEENREQRKKLSEELSTSRVSRFKFDPQKVMAMLRHRIVGQTQTLEVIEDLLITIKADFCEQHRPLCITLLMGPTGTGKTETVRLLSEGLLGSSKKLCRIDMNTLGQEHYSASITGSPPGYVGSKEGTSLLNKNLIEGTFSEPGIVLFDEIEKADKSVSRAIMNIFDTGKLVLTAGSKEIDFSNTLVFMTSNIVVKELKIHQKFFSQLLKPFRKITNFHQDTTIEGVLLTHFDPEFINRIDHTCLFSKIEQSQLGRIIDIEIEKLNVRLLKKEVKVKISRETKNFLVKDYNNFFGARDVKRTIKKQIEPKIAKAMLSAPTEKEFFVILEYKSIIVRSTLASI